MEREEAYSIVAPLLAGPRDQAGELDPSYAETILAHFGRKAFYVASAKCLDGRSNRINQYIHGRPNNDPRLHSGRRPNTKVIPNLAGRQPETLGSIARAQNALSAIKSSGDADVRKLTCFGSVDGQFPAEKCYEIEAKSITPSIYIADGRAIESARGRLGMSRVAASREVFGQHAHNMFQILEDGDGDVPLAVTFALKRRVEGFFEQSGIEEMLFAANAAKFAKTLAPSRGNLLQLA